jgi:DNA ligase (NAD+)
LRGIGAALLVLIGCLGDSSLLLRGAEPASSGASDSVSGRRSFLRSEIQRHDELYHRRALPEITDAEYDELKRELLELETGESKTSAAASRSLFTAPDDRRAESPVYAHGQPMLSLDKAYTESEVRRFHERVVTRLGHEPVYVIEPKFDGIAVSAVYVEGKLIRVLTRGDGVTGEDVTANAVKYASVPDTLIRTPGFEMPSSIEVRGEIFMSFGEFERVNREREAAGEMSHASPRNLAAGTLKSNGDLEVADRRLENVFFSVGTCEPDSRCPATQGALLSRLTMWGLRAPEHFRIAHSLDAMWSLVNELGSSRENWEFPSDGLVVKVDARKDQQTLGASDDGPRWALAFKFPSERQTTLLKAITLQVGRTGLITPVAELAPVQFGSALITRATLHNAAEIARRDLRVGDYVVIERGGEIIPVIISADLSRRSAQSAPFVFPQVCPSCSGVLRKRDQQIAWYCMNEMCREQIRRRVLHFASAGCVGIRGLGPTTVNSLVDSGRVRTFSDLYALQLADLSDIRSESAAVALMSAITESKKAELWRFIHGFGIEGVGQRSAKRIAAQFGSIDLLAAATIDDLGRIDGIRTGTATNIVNFFASPAGDDIRRALQVDRF